MSLHKSDWAKIVGGLALLATGAGAAGVGPLAGALGSSAGAAGATGAGAAATGAAGAAGGGFGGLVAPALVGTGLSTSLSGLAGTQKQAMMQPAGVPPMQSQTDPFDILRSIQAMKQGRMS